MLATRANAHGCTGNCSGAKLLLAHTTMRCIATRIRDASRRDASAHLKVEFVETGIEFSAVQSLVATLDLNTTCEHPMA